MSQTAFKKHVGDFLNETVGEDPVMENVSVDKETGEQLTFTFSKQFSEVAMAEAVRGVKAIMKEAFRLGADVRTIRMILEPFVMMNPIVKEALEVIEDNIDGKR